MKSGRADLSSRMFAGLEARSVEILAALGPVKYHRGWKYFLDCNGGAVEQIALYPVAGAVASEARLELAMYPADTVTQARWFGEHVRDSEFLSLAERGWDVRPNLHFSHIQKHRHWSHRHPSLRAYLEYWYRSPDRLIQIRRGQDGFTKYFDELKRDGQIDGEDVRNLNELFTQSKRNSLNSCPGFAVRFGWDLDVACALDTAGSYVDAVRGKIDEAFVAWGQTFA